MSFHFGPDTADYRVQLLELLDGPLDAGDEVMLMLMTGSTEFALQIIARSQAEPGVTVWRIDTREGLIEPA